MVLDPSLVAYHLTTQNLSKDYQRLTKKYNGEEGKFDSGKG